MAKIILTEEGTKPPAPSVGQIELYAKSDDNLYIQNSAGVETPVAFTGAITALTGDVTATGPESVPATVNSVGGASAANIASSVASYLSATSADSSNTLVERDSGGNFAANAIALVSLSYANSSFLASLLWIPIANFNLTLPSTQGGVGTFLQNDGSGNLSWTGIAGGGTVTGVSVVTANGISGSVATPTSTPAITLTLGNISPTSVAASGTVTGSNIAGTNTGDQTISVTGPLTSTGGLDPTLGITGSSLTEATSSVLTITGGGASQLAATTIQVSQASGSSAGYLSSTDWTTFNNKQGALTFSDSLVNTSGTITLSGDSASPGNTLYYGTNGSGVKGFYTLPGSSGANTALGNLASVAINLSLLPASNNSIDLGSSSLAWAHAYIATQLYTPLITGVGSTGAAITLRGGLAASSGAGGNVTVTGANGDSGNGAGGSLTLNGGTAGGAGGTNESGGAVSMAAGNSVGSASGGTVTISSGNGGTGTGTAGASGGTTNINGGLGGAGSSTSGQGGGVTCKGGSGGGGVAGGAGGQAQLIGGTGGTGSASGGNGGAANLQGGSAGSVAGAAGGTCTIQGGNGTGTGSGGAGGAVTIATGAATGDNTTNNTGGSLTLSCGHSFGSSSGAAMTLTSGTGGIGTGTAGATGGALNLNAGTGGAGSSTGGGGGNIVMQAGVGGSSTTPGTGGYIQFQTASSTSLTEKMRILAAGGVNIVNGALNITTAGNGLAIAHGSNCKLGTATLSAGSVVVSNTTITSNSIIFVTVQTLGTVSVPSAVAVTAKNVGTSFTITSSASNDTSTVAWMIVEQL